MYEQIVRLMESAPMSRDSRAIRIAWLFALTEALVAAELGDLATEASDAAQQLVGEAINTAASTSDPARSQS